MPQRSITSFNADNFFNKMLWHEGLLMSPQHFQMTDFLLQNAINYVSSKINPYIYGIGKINIDLASLTAGTFRILSADGMFQDGLIFSYDSSYDAPLEKKIKEHFITSSEPVNIYLAMMKHKIGENLLASNLQRFKTCQINDVGDESVDTEKINVLMLKPALHLLFEKEVDGRYLAFQVAQICKNNADSNIYLSDYVAPSISLNKDSKLCEIFRDIVYFIRQKIEGLSSTRSNSLLYTDLDTQQRIQILIQALLPFEAIINLENLHPFEYYKILITTVAHLISLNTYQILPQITIYDHNDLHQTFMSLQKFIKSVLEFLKQIYITIPFLKNENIFTLDMKPEFLTRNKNDDPNKIKELIISFKRPFSCDDEKFLTWVNGVQICSQSLMQQIKNARILGVDRRIVERGEKISPASDCLMIAINVESSYIKSGEKLCIFNSTNSMMADDAILYFEKYNE